MKYIIVSKQDDDLFITLNRPLTGNCYHYDMCREIEEAFQKIDTSSNNVILSGNGNNFCTGADLRWMKASLSLSPDENIKDMSVIKDMYRAIIESPLPIITKVQGKVRGGGMGLIACSDYVVAKSDADFALSEVKLGLIPGIITPFIINKTGKKTFDDLAETGRVIKAQEALKLNIIHEISDQMNIREIKLTHQELLQYFSPHDQVQEYLLQSAKKRQSPEFLARINSFFK